MYIDLPRDGHNIWREVVDLVQSALYTLLSHQQERPLFHQYRILLTMHKGTVAFFVGVL